MVLVKFKTSILATTVWYNIFVTLLFSPKISRNMFFPGEDPHMKVTGVLSSPRLGCKLQMLVSLGVFRTEG